jgi:GT2 family glycosyltransferase
VSGGDGIDLSVIVPTYNRPAALRECLGALASQDYPRDRFEVLVVDDGGESSPAPVIEEMRSRLSVELLTQAHAGPSRARNLGAGMARGRFLAFTDDDCRPQPTWLARLAAALERAPDSIVGGRIVNSLPDNAFSSASQMIADIVYAHYNADPENARFFSSNNFAMAAESYRALGGFDEGFLILACEDRELCDRWRATGGRMIYEPEAVVGHAHSLALYSFVRQHFTYGRGAVHFHRIRAERASGTLRDEMSFHVNVSNWLAQPFRCRTLVDATRIAALMVLWQGANLAGFAFELLARSGYRPSGDAQV